MGVARTGQPQQYASGGGVAHDFELAGAKRRCVYLPYPSDWHGANTGDLENLCTTTRDTNGLSRLGDGKQGH